MTIYDFPDQPAPVAKEEPVKRSKHRQSISLSSIRAGQVKLQDMIDTAFQALQEAMIYADHSTAIKAAQIVLDRSGYGPKSTVDVNSVHLDLSELSRDELAERASALAKRIRGNPSTQTVINAESTTVQ